MLLKLDMLRLNETYYLTSKKHLSSSA